MPRHRNKLEVAHLPLIFIHNKELTASIMESKSTNPTGLPCRFLVDQPYDFIEIVLTL